MNTRLTVSRHGQSFELPLAMICKDDLVLGANGWYPAHTYVELAPFFPSPAPPAPVPLSGREALVTFAKRFFGTLAVVGTAVVAYKGVQALTDEDFGTVEFPEWFRHEKIDEHIAAHGSRCPRCRRRVRRADLTVDHIVALRNGGRTSRQNAQVLCRSCNSSKGRRNVPLDYLRGRSS